MGKMKVASFLLLAAIGCVMVESTSGLIHVVGGSYGWDAPQTKTFYAEWAAPRTFGVGDQLVFPYRPSTHEVERVSKEDFDACTRNNVIQQWMLGPTIVPLTAPGDYYFYCGVGIHCDLGQKLHIVVGTCPGSDGINWAAKVIPGRKMLSGNVPTARNQSTKHKLWF